MYLKQFVKRYKNEIDDYLELAEGSRPNNYYERKEGVRNYKYLYDLAIENGVIFFLDKENI